MYLTNNEYLDMGGNIDDEDVFNRLESKARAHIDRVTFGRLVGESPVRDAVKNCMYDLISAVAADEQLGASAYGRDVASMSNDGVSITFANGSNRKSAAARYNSIVRMWLSNEVTACGLPLLYAGVSMR